jgi:hypothetical protein
MQTQLGTGEMDLGKTERRKKKVGHSECNVPEVARIKCPKKLSIFSRRSWKSTKVKVNSVVGAFYSTTALWLIVLLTPKGVPSFISRGAAYSDLS